MHMPPSHVELLREENLRKLEVLDNPHVKEQVERFVELCKPSKVTVITDDPEEINYVRNLATKTSEETELRIRGHTVHFDGYLDQARDKEHTAVLLPQGLKISRSINYVERNAGLKEINGLLDGAMEGKECIVRFFSLGPTKSRFTICALQLTDSSYVAHSEDLLYRSGYEEFKNLEKERNTFYQTMDQDLFKRYVFLKERKGGHAISSVVKGVCQTCHMGIPPQKFNELIKGKSLLTCPNCQRIIYWGEDEQFLKTQSVNG